MVDLYIKKLVPTLQEMCKGNNTGGHNLDHFIRTMKLALFIQSKEGGDPVILCVSSLLHDVHRLMQGNSLTYVSPKESLSMVRNIIDASNLELTVEQIDEILFCIEHHEDYNWNGNNVSDLNTLILQDADNLDAIGAIGIARSFGYAAVNNQPFYLDSVPLEKFSGYSEKVMDISNIHFLNNKLIKLGDNMNTNTAKEIASKRVKFIEEFIDEFLEEWDVNY